MPDVSLWRRVAEIAREGGRAAIATVAECRGSTPVPPGAKMLVGESTRLGGTVGGGCVEAEVIAAGLEVERTGAPRLVTHHLNADLAGDLGLSCGGTVRIFVEPVMAGAETVRLYEAAARAAADTVSAVVATAVAWAGARPAKAFASAALVVALDDGLAAAARAALNGAAQLPTTHLEANGTRLIEPILAPPRLVLFGAGHVGRALAAAARAAGFRVVVVDDRAEFANPERIPDAELVVADYRSALDRVALEADDFVVVATRGHRHDALIIERVAPSPARYIGLLGSRRKGAVVRKALAGAGIPEAALARVRVPVGLPIGAATAEEIAVSVVAEMIAERRGPRARGKREGGRGKRP